VFIVVWLELKDDDVASWKELFLRDLQAFVEFWLRKISWSATTVSKSWVLPAVLPAKTVPSVLKDWLESVPDLDCPDEELNKSILRHCSDFEGITRLM
jgi:hypothetical protein